MKRLLCIFLFVVVDAFAAEPVVRVAIDGKPPYLVGQPVRVAVDVLVPNYFMSGVSIPEIDIPGAVVSRPDESAQHLTEAIGGQSYAGIRQWFVVTPQREGEITLPPAKLTFRYAAEPGKAAAGVLALPPRKFSVQLPAGAKTAAGVLPVAKVTVKQTLDRNLKGLRTGDAITRTVTVFAERTQAMMIPPPEFEAPGGVRVYEKDPVLADVTDPRGAFVGGRRTDRATYVFEKPGEYTLPGIEFAWFDAAAGRQRKAVAPKVVLSIVPNPDYRPEIAPEAPAATAPPARHIAWKRILAWTVVALLIVLAVAWSIRRLLPRCVARVAAKRRARAESEPAYFARAQAACHANDPRAAYAAILAWQRRSGARADIALLEGVLFGRQPAEDWNGAAMAISLAEVRRRFLETRTSRHRRSPALPALNP